jgi:hypothetical protein
MTWYDNHQKQLYENSSGHTPVVSAYFFLKPIRTGENQWL